jgi:transcriptional regulator with XRE-family HTH domain
MPLAKLVAQNLFEARSRRKFSQQTVANKAGLSVSYISMLERRVRVPPLETLEAIAKALGVPPLDLFQARSSSRRSRRDKR